MIKSKIFMAIALPVILITGGLGFYLLGQEHTNIDIIEGYSKFNYTILTEAGDLYGSIHGTSTATTIINNGEGHLSFKVVFGSYSSHDQFLEITMRVFAVASLVPNLSSNSFVFRAREMDNLTAAYDFLGSFSEAHNATVWGDDEIVPGAWAPHKAYIGFTPTSKNFNASGMISWKLFDYKSPHTYTLRLEAVCKIGSVEVPAIIDIAIKTQSGI